jgi:hypothetical protein
MAKWFYAFLISIMVFLFITGCSFQGPEPAETIRTQMPQPEPVGIKPPVMEPNEIIPAKTELNEITSLQPEPDATEPNQVKPFPKVTFHNKCADLLNDFVDNKGMVDYGRLRRQRLMLIELSKEFAKLDPNEYNRWPKNDKIAFWLNAYNIHTLKIIVDNYPIQSLRYMHIFPGWGPHSIRHINKNIDGIKNQKFIVMDEEFTLAEIEERFFYKEFAEPKVFFAMCDAIVSSPPLRNEPYYGYKLYGQLDDQAKKFLKSPQGFWIDRESKVVYLSAILQPSWYGKKFVAKYVTDKKFKDQPAAVRAVLNFITNYIPMRDIAFLETEIYSVKYIRYDWRLNDRLLKNNL